VPRWDVENVARPDVELGAVVHSEASCAGNTEADVVELAAHGSRGGAGVFRVPVAGFQHQAADHELSDPDRGRRTLCEGERFVRI
jgi:hypothetical protein